jgi:phage terminase large subunit
LNEQPDQNLIQIPRVFDCIYIKDHADFHYTHFVFYGGRSAMKSWCVVRAILARANQEPLIILCVREYRESMRFSIKALIEQQIEKTGQKAYWHSTRTSIISLLNGSEFVFYGMNVNPQSLKSFESCNILLAEESGDLSKRSLINIIPTVIRNEGAKCYWIFNPEFIDDPVYEQFIVNHDPETTLLTKLTYLDNPWTTEATAKQASKDREKDFDEYSWNWLGNLRTNSKTKVFAGRFTVRVFETDNLGDPYFGVDWGFSNSPTVIIKCYVHDNVLYVRYAKGKVKLELDDNADYFDCVPESRDYPLKADAARPEIISYMRRAGWFNMSAATKPADSVEFGVQWLLALDDIIIYPGDAEQAVDDFSKYSYVLHARTKEPTTHLAKKDDDSIDAVRYALNKLIYSQDDRYSSGIGQRKYNQ